MDITRDVDQSEIDPSDISTTSMDQSLEKFFKRVKRKIDTTAAETANTAANSQLEELLSTP